MDIINWKDIVVHPVSTGHDETLFFYNNKLFRAPYSHKISMYNNLLSDKDNLNKTNLQKIEETDFVLNHPVHNLLKVFEHKIYNHLVKIQESTLQRKIEFIKTICNINKFLIPKGYVLCDVHEGNIYDSIDGVVWVDWGSIYSLKENFNEGRYHIASSSLALTLYLTNKYIYNMYKGDHTTYDILKAANTNSPVKNIAALDPVNLDTWDQLSNIVSGTNIPIYSSTHWADEYATTSSAENVIELNIKGKSFDELLNKIKYETLTDVGCNKGYYTIYASKNVKSAIGFDFDEKCIAVANNKKPNNLPILFAKKDIKEFNTFEQENRYSSDLVIALAIVHHMGKIIPHAQFAKILCNLSKKHIIIEDIDTLSFYQNEFKKYGFNLIERKESSPNSRTLSLYSRVQ